MIFACSKKKDYSHQINYTLKKWSASQQFYDYNQYKKFVRNTKSKKQFLNIFDNYYFENPVLIDYTIIEDKSDYIELNTNVSLYSVNRNNESKEFITGNITINKKKGDDNFKIAGHLLYK